jgi:hypothetical protein
MSATSRRSWPGLRRSLTGRGRAKNRRFQPAICGLEDRQLLSTFTWDSNAGGAFSSAQNWTDQNGHHGVPGASDIAIIKGSGFTVSINQATTVGSLSSNAQVAINSGSLTLDHLNQTSSIASLVLSAGTLDLVGGLSIPGRFTWTGGTLEGPGEAIVEKGASLQIATSSTSSLANDGVLVNNGTVTWNEAGGEISGDGTINNAGTFNIQGVDPLEQVYANPIDGTFNNSGSLMVSGARPTIDSLNSTGTIDIANYSYLTIAGNSTVSGVLSAAAGTTVSFYGAVNNAGTYVPGVATVKPGTAFEGSGFFSVWNHETLALDTNVAPANFLVSGGTVTGSGNLTVTNKLQFSGGVIAPAVVSVPTNASFSIDNYYNDAGFGWTLAAGTVNLAGQTDWNTPSALALGGQTTINNLKGAVFTIQCDQMMTGGTFNNQGVITKVYDAQTSTGKGTTRLGTSLSDTGSVLVNSGTLNLAGNGIFAGTFNAAAGTSFVFGGGRQIVNTGTVFSGPGAYILDDGPSGSLVVDGSVTAPNNFSFVGGTLDLVGTLSVPGRFTWTGGTLAGAGRLAIGKGGVIEIGPAGAASLVNDATLVNNGTATWSAAVGEIYGGGTIDNSGTFKIDGSDSGFSQIDGPLNNSGTIVIDGGLPILNSLNTTGTIDVINYGSLTIAGNSTVSGLIDAAADTAVNFFGAVNSQGCYVPGVATVKPGAAFDGPGTYGVFDSETLAMETNLTMANLQVAGGTVVGCGSLTVTTLLEFDGGAISPAVVNIPAGSTFLIDPAGNDGSYGWILGATTVNLAGQTEWAVNDAGNLELGSHTIINNLPTGDFSIETDTDVVGGAINNAGLIIKTVPQGGVFSYGTTTIGSALNNTGTVEVSSGTLNLAGAVAQVSAATLTGGTWSVVNATGDGSVLTISSAGAITTIGPGASVTLDGRYTTFTNLASLSANDGTFRLLDGQSFQTQGSLGNYGTIDLGAGDALGVNGNYGQASTATLNLTIAGTSSSGLVSHLYVSGDAYFGGTLNITVPSTFTPVYDDRYVLLTYRHVRSFFGAIHVSPLNDGEFFTVQYIPQGLYLRVY